MAWSRPSRRSRTSRTSATSSRTSASTRSRPRPHRGRLGRRRRPEKALIIAHGHYDLAKFKAKGEDAAKTNGDILKIHKREKGPLIYEVKLPQADTTVFVALADKNTMLISPGKDYVIDGLKKIDSQKPTVKNKEIQTLIGGWMPSRPCRWRCSAAL